MQAPNYTPTTDFSDDESNNAGGRSTIRTDRLDTELQNIALSINQGNINLQLIQRDDGQLRDAIINPNNFTQTTKAYVLATKWNARGLWTTATHYFVNDMAEVAGVSYISLVDHISGVFNTDRSNGYWQIFIAASRANGVTFAATTTITSIDVQSAIEEVDTKSRAGSDPLLSAFYGGL